MALTGTPVENGLGDLWAILDFTNPGLVGPRNAFIEHLSRASEAVPASANGPTGAGSARHGRRPAGGPPPAARSSEESALRALNGLLIFRRTKSEPEIAAELPDKVDKLDHCSMTAEQIGLYQAVVNRLLEGGLDGDSNQRKGAVLAAITALKQICDHPAAYLRDDDDQTSLVGRSGKLARLEEIVGRRVRRRRADPDLHPLRPLGGGAGQASERAAPGRRSAATTAASAAASATS